MDSGMFKRFSDVELKGILSFLYKVNAFKDRSALVRKQVLMYRNRYPLWGLQFVILYFLALCPLWVKSEESPMLVASFTPDQLTVNMNKYRYVNVTVVGDGLQVNDEMLLTTDDHRVAIAEWDSTYTLTEEDVSENLWNGIVRVHGVFLGRTPLTVEVRRGNETFQVNGTLPLIVIRPERVIDTVFTVSVAVFISLIFINFGCAMHWPTVKKVLKKPIGPIIGMCGQFLFMPLMSFGLGFLIFWDNPAMRLGMFVTGVAPGGGASNIWTFILGGNLNLSLAMTSISTLASFGFMPAWLFSLGQVAFRDANIAVPYMQITYFVIGLLVPLGIGLAMQKFTPRISAFMVRILKVFSTMCLIFIIVFAIITNLYIFELFTWQIIVAGIGQPWLGYAAGYGFARLLRQPHPDALAISIETGIQNTGIAIFLLRYTLEAPEMDLTTVVPVACAIMTPIPMTAIFIYQKIKACVVKYKEPKKTDEILSPVDDTKHPEVIATADVTK